MRFQSKHKEDFNSKKGFLPWTLEHFGMRFGMRLFEVQSCSPSLQQLGYFMACVVRGCYPGMSSDYGLIPSLSHKLDRKLGYKLRL